MEFKLTSLKNSFDSFEYQAVINTVNPLYFFSFENFSKYYLRVGNKERLKDDCNKATLTVNLEEFYIHEFNDVTIDKLCILYDEHCSPIRDSLNTYDDIDNFVEESGVKNFDNIVRMNLEKAPIIFFDHYFYNFTHFVFEAFPRLFLVKELLKKGHKVLVPPKINSQHKRYDYYQHIQPCLDSLGITTEDIIEIPEGGAKFTNLIMPSHIKFRPDCVLPAVEHLKNYYFDPNFEWPYPHLYISREDTKLRNITNKNQVEMVLCKYFNFKKIMMSDYSFKEKINIMAKTNILVSVESSSITNCIFMPEESKILALRLIDIVFHSIPLTSLFNQDIYFQICDFGTHDNSHHSGHLFVDIVRLFDNAVKLTEESPDQSSQKKTRTSLVFFRLFLQVYQSIQKIWIKIRYTCFRIKINWNKKGIEKLKERFCNVFKLAKKVDG